MPSSLSVRNRRGAHAALAMMLLVSMPACGGGGDASAPPAVTSVSVAPASLTLSGLGSTASVAATVTPSSSNATVRWQSDDPAIATVSGSGSTATITAVGGGVVRVTATVGSVAGNTTVTVTPVVKSVTVASPTVSLVINGSARIVPTVSADVGASTTLAFASSASSVASVSTDGTITALSVGAATITVSSAAFPSVQTTVQVTVNYPEVRSIAITPGTTNIVRGSTRQLSAAVDVDAGNSTGVTWSSSSPTVASVSATGLLTAVATGDATIRATSVANPGASATLALTVVSPTVRAITLGPVPASVPQFATLAVVATIDADAGANTTLAWTTTNTAIALVNAAGVVTGVAAGTVTIRATSLVVPAVTATLQVTVGPPAPLTTWTARSTLPPSTIMNNDLIAVHTLANGNAWAVPELTTSDRRILRYNGTSWSVADVAPFGGISALGGAANTAWLGSSTGAVARLSANGQSWQLLSSPANSAIVRIVGIDSTTAVIATHSNIYVVTGDVWATLPAVGMYIVDIAANAVDDVVAIGPLAAVPFATRRWNGSFWLAPQEPSITQPLGLVALRGSEITVVSGIRLEYATSSVSGWTIGAFPATRAGSVEGMQSLVSCAGSLFASTNSGRVFRFVGSAWTTIADYGAAPVASSSVVLDCGANGVLRAAGNDGSISRYTGSNWVAEIASPSIKRLVMVRPDLAYATAGHGTVMKWDGIQWGIDLTEIANSVESPGSTNNGLTGLSVAPDGTVMVSGGDDFFQPRRILRRAPNGVWSKDLVNVPCRDVFAASSSFALAVGVGLVAGPRCQLRWNGSTWATATGVLPPDVLAMHGSSTTFAVTVGSTLTNASAVSHWNGIDWFAVATPNVGPLTLVRTFNASLAFAAGTGGILRWNGTVWENMSRPAGLALVNDISINAPNDVYAVTMLGDLYHFDGSTWTRVVSIPGVFTVTARPGVLSLSTISGYGIVGLSGGAILHATPPAGANTNRFSR